MAGLQFPVALVKMKKGSYVIFSTKFIRYPGRKYPFEDKVIDEKFDSISFDLWGEGIPIKTVMTSQTNFDMKEDIKVFKKQIKIYEDSCKQLKEESQLVFNAEAENNMIEMGLPFVYGYEDQPLLDDLYFVMTSDMYAKKFVPEINKEFPVGFASFNVIQKESVVKKISEIICYYLNK